MKMQKLICHLPDEQQLSNACIFIWLCPPAPGTSTCILYISHISVVNDFYKLLPKEVIKYFKFYLDYLYLWYFSSILHFYHIKKESAVKLTSYLNSQTLSTYTPGYYLSPLMCLFYLQYLKCDIVPGFVMPHVF